MAADTSTPSVGYATRSINVRFLIPMFTTKISAQETSRQIGCVALWTCGFGVGRTNCRSAKKVGPLPYKKTPQTPSFGTPAESDDITGGIGYEGLAQIQKFVDDGGLMVTLGSGSMLALEGGIVRGVRRSSGGVPRSTARGRFRFRRRGAKRRDAHAVERTYVSALIVLIIRLPTDIRSTPGFSVRTSLSMTRLRNGCGWRTAQLALMDRRIPAQSNGVGQQRWFAVRREWSSLG